MDGNASQEVEVSGSAIFGVCEFLSGSSASARLLLKISNGTSENFFLISRLNVPLCGCQLSSSPREWRECGNLASLVSPAK